MGKKLILISSTQYPGYGGAATNAYAIIKYLRSQNYKTVGLFFNSKQDVNYNPENLEGIFLFDLLRNKKEEEINELKKKIKTAIVNYLGREPDICFAKNYLAPLYCKEIFNESFVVYLVSGINHFPLFFIKDNLCGSDILKKKRDFFLNKDIPKEIECNKKSDLIVLNSLLSKKVFEKIYEKFRDKIYPDIIDTTKYLNLNISKQKINKKYDICICSTNLTRKDKNNEFLINILKNKIFNKYKKCIIGEKYEKFKIIPNSNFFGLLTQEKTINKFKECRILLFPSLMDANSNTVREAYQCKCIPIISNNIGFREKFPKFLVCKSYNKNEWIFKILFVLKNYKKIKNIRINFDIKKI